MDFDKTAHPDSVSTCVRSLEVQDSRAPAQQVIRDVEDRRDCSGHIGGMGHLCEERLRFLHFLSPRKRGVGVAGQRHVVESQLMGGWLELQETARASNEAPISKSLSHASCVIRDPAPLVSENFEEFPPTFHVSLTSIPLRSS